MGANNDWQMFSDFIGIDVKRRRNLLQSIVCGFFACIFLDHEVVAVLVVKASLVRADHNIVDPHEASEEDVKSRWHHTLREAVISQAK